MGVERVKRKLTTALLAFIMVLAGSGLALGYNPARVEMADGLRVGLTAEASGELNSFGYRLLGLLNKHWSDEERLAVADSLGDKEVYFTVLAEPAVFVQYNNFRIHGGAAADGWAAVPTELAEVAFRGITLEQLDGGKVNYDFSRVQAQAGSFAFGGVTAVFSAAQYLGLDIEDLVVGVAGRYLYGLAYGETDFAGTLQYIEEDGKARIVSTDLDFSVLYARQGQGWAFDAGVYAQVSPRLAVDVSVENVGQVVWTGVSSRRYYRPGEWELLSFGFDPETYELDFQFADGEELQEEELTDLPDITWKLPVRVRVGAQFEFDQQVTLRGNIRHVRYGNGAADFGIGGQVEYRPVAFLPLTFGADYSTRHQFALDGGMGLRFDHFSMQLTAQNLQSLFLKSGKGLGLAFSIGVEF